VGNLRRLIAFDLDGTLVDSRRDLAESASQLVVERGGRALSQDEVVAMVGEGAALLVQRAMTAAGAVQASDALARFLAIYDERLLNHTLPYAGVLDAVHAAKAIARVAVLTNKPLHHTTRLLAGLGIAHLFDEVVGGDGPHPRKPDPQGLEALMASAGATGPATLMVGDSLVDYQTADRAGACCCLVSFGFGFARIPPHEVRAGALVAADTRSLLSVVQDFGR
jgi:phosphoglycolate phosphatase